MTPLLVPTRNRPTALSNLLAYLARFYPATRVIIADGSQQGYQLHNRQVVDSYKQDLALEHRLYPATVPYFDRILDVLRTAASDFVIMGADDDYPMLDTLSAGEAYLRSHPDYALALGMNVNLDLRSPTDLRAQLYVAWPITADDPSVRARQFGAWHYYFATTQAVARREVLVERYERARKLFVPGFYDFAVGVHDCLQGKIAALPSLGFVLTHNYTHSYLRPEAELSFLRRSGEVLRLAGQIRKDLMQYAGLDEAAAQKASVQLIKQRIRVMVGRPWPVVKGSEDRALLRRAVVQQQFRMFEALFEEGTPARARYHDRLMFILAAIKENARSDDNKGEQGKFETLEQMLDAPEQELD